MKSFQTLIFLLVFFVGARAQYVTIPDARFVAWLQANIPSAMNGNQMDTTNVSVINLPRVIIQDDSIGDLTGVQYFDSLKTLNCGFLGNYNRVNHISNLPRLPALLDTLICDNNNLTALPTLPNALKYLNCNYNSIVNLPNLPNSLIFLFCEGNQIVNFSSLPPSLNYFHCGSNQMTGLPSLPTSLKGLSCGGAPLVNLPTLPNTLLYLACPVDSLTSLPTLPSQLDSLNCNTNKITTLPALPSNLRILCCLQNKLSTLPALPLSLRKLYCQINQLSSLPLLPDTLRQLYCYNNQLTSMPVLPGSLWTLNCQYNFISNLPNIPDSLQDLEAQQNLLTSLPPLPNTLHTLYLGNNSISCFPIFPNSISFIGLAANPFSCLPNKIPAMGGMYNSIPLCVSGNLATNPNGCPTGQGVTGKIYHDNNGNCSFDAGEATLSNVSIRLIDNNGNVINQTYSGQGYDYSLSGPAGSYTVSIDTAGMPFKAQCVTSGLDSSITFTANNPIDSNVNFSLQCKPGFDIGIQAVVPKGIVFPGQQHQVVNVVGDMGTWYNLNCSAGVSGQVQVTITGNVAYSGPASGALTPSVSGNTCTYLISDFGTINPLSDFNIILTVNPNAQVGDTVCVSITVTPFSGDNNPANNTFVFCYEVGNSFDPNFKEVYPSDVNVGYSDWFTYTVHFQNTGTAAALNIHIEDLLDTYLDVSTFEVITASHSNMSYLSGQQLSINFPNINLPDSTSNTAGSQGYVQYRIKPKPNLPGGTQIKNTAYIYFDFNPAVITNTTVNHFINGIGVKEESEVQLSLHPNPASESFVIDMRGGFKGKLALYSVQGQLLLEENVDSKTKLIDISSLEPGIYLVKIGPCTAKLVKN